MSYKCSSKNCGMMIISNSLDKNDREDYCLSCGKVTIFKWID